MKTGKKFLSYLLPHPLTHKKSPLLSWHFLIIYILLFVLLRTGLDLVNLYKPGVLGVNSNIDVQQIIANTNQERQKAGLPVLVENPALSKAALAKAQNMFAEDYWAHFAPSGKDPWQFIKSAGYNFSYAGENLARNFYNSGDVVQAWMNSPSHRDNILNARYQDIGIAVSEGVLQGQKTTVVVQMFGRKYEALPAPQRPQAEVQNQTVAPPSEQEIPHRPLIAGSSLTQSVPKPALIDPFMVTRTAGIVMMLIIVLLLTVDFIALQRRGVFRPSSHHLAHLGFLAVAGASLFLSRIGEVL